MKPFLPYFFCCDVIAPTYCLSAERLSAHRSVWKDKKNALLVKSGRFFSMRFLAKMRSRFRGSRAEKSRRRRGCCLLGIVTFCTTLHAHGESHPFTLPASCRLPPPLRYLPLMPWWGRWISHCCCWEPIERRSLLPKSTIAQRKRQLKTKHCIRVSPRLTTFSNGDLKSDSAIYVRKTAVILNVFPIAPDLASFSPLGIVNPLALRLYLPNIFMLLLTVHNRRTNSKQLLWRSYESLPEVREAFCRSGIKCYTFPTPQFLHDGKMNVSFRKGSGMQNGTRPAKCLLQPIQTGCCTKHHMTNQ